MVCLRRFLGEIIAILHTKPVLGAIPPETLQRQRHSRVKHQRVPSGRNAISGVYSPKGGSYSPPAGLWYSTSRPAHLAKPDATSRTEVKVRRQSENLQPTQADNRVMDASIMRKVKSIGEELAKLPPEERALVALVGLSTFLVALERAVGDLDAEPVGAGRFLESLREHRRGLQQGRPSDAIARVLEQVVADEILRS